MKRAMRQAHQTVKGMCKVGLPHVAGLGLALLTSLSETARAEPRVEFGEAGVFTATPLRREPEPGAPAGFRMVITDVRLAETTDTICARLGLTFGMRYTVRGGPRGQPVQLSMVTRFPPQGMTTPDGRTHAVSRFAKDTAFDADELRVYGFDEPFEILVGPWTFEFHLDGRKIGEKTFRVITDCGTS
jgi:hypothetical protein